MVRRVRIAAVMLGLMVTLPVAGQRQAALDVRIDAGEAEAVLAIVRMHGAEQAIPESAWAALFATDGYRRLQQREHGMGRVFEDTAFRRFVLSDSLVARADALARTLAAWNAIDARAAAERAFAYLPAGTAVRATIYPVVKPATNTFVFEVMTDPAIFFYLDPELSAARFENTLAHELHHIGYATACASAPDQPIAARLRLGAFGEGVAMLAAAGAPDVHPHTSSPPADRARWDADVARFDDDLRTLEQYFLDVLDGRLDEDAARARAMSFYGVQGPWYTVGWVMAAEVERAFGRARLVGLLCDPVALLQQYNEAVRARGTAAAPATWSDSLLARLQP